MGCGGKKKKGGGRKFVALAGLISLIGGCSASDVASLKDPIFVNGIATQSKAGCMKAVQEDCGKAKTGLDVLQVVLPQLEACQQGLIEGIAADPNCTN